MDDRVSSADGTTIAVQQSGNPGGPTVVAVHGFPDNHSVWDGVAAELGGQFRVVTYDVRGAGESDAPSSRSGYRMERLVDDLAAVVDSVWDGRPVHLLAHDWGSIQTWPALTDPRLSGRIAGFVSISGPSLDHAARWLRAGAGHPVAATRQLLHSYYIDLFMLPRLPELAARAGVFDRGMERANARTRSALARDEGSYRRERDKVNGINLYRANMLSRMSRPAPKDIDIPVLVVAPERDAYVTPPLATGAPAPYVRDLHTRTIAGGHWVVGQRPDVIAACVREFVAYVETGAPLRSRQLVLVTGGARGIGRATALEFARKGADIVLADVNDVGAKETVDELRALGVDAWSYHLDVSDADAWTAFAERVRAEHGVPDVVVNNAGIGMGGSFLHTTVTDWKRIIGINLWGVIHGSRLFGQQMVERGFGGQIVNIASAAAYSPSIVYPAYATTKSAVLMLTECLRAEFEREGIGVTAICPGFVDSDISKSTVHVGVDDDTQAALREHAVASYKRRNYTPERLARHIVRAAERNTPVAAVSIESKAFRAISRFAPALGRRIAKIDLNELGR